MGFLSYQTIDYQTIKGFLDYHTDSHGPIMYLEIQLSLDLDIAELRNRKDKRERTLLTVPEMTSQFCPDIWDEPNNKSISYTIFIVYILNNKHLSYNITYSSKPSLLTA